ncbi:MAG: hypothetical protein WCK89_00405 [bacterium]
MSTDFVPSRRIAFERLRQFRFGGVYAEPDDPYGVILTDGKNVMRASPAGVGYRAYFSTGGGNDVIWIIAALEECLHVWIIPDFEEEFEEIVKADRAKATRRLRARRAAGRRKAI